MKILAVIGTRPEAIKMLPLIIELKKYRDFEVLICSSGQHGDILKCVFDYFNIEPDFSFCAMKKGQSLSRLTTRLLNYFDALLDKISPDLLLAHGDTTTAFCASLSAFYKGIKIAHVEAGLRTYDKRSPFPEELNRVTIDALADLHFAPTQLSRSRLEKEGRGSVFVVGNTGIDALSYTLDNNYVLPVSNKEANKKILLVTTHRRENIGSKMRSSLLAVRDILEYRNDFFAVFPVHPNPAVRAEAISVFEGIKNIKICEPLTLYDFHNILARAFAVFTDSGGIQEEASFLGVPVFLLRDTTEREEGMVSGNIRLVGTDRMRIFEDFLRVSESEEELSKMRSRSFAFGDGHACEKIVKILLPLSKNNDIIK